MGQKSAVTKLRYSAVPSQFPTTARRILPVVLRLAARHVAGLAHSGHSIQTRNSAMSPTSALVRTPFALTELTPWAGRVEASSLLVPENVLLSFEKYGVD